MRNLGEDTIAQSDHLPVAAARYEAVSRAVMLNQMLWTAGYALTTSGFLLYFAAELGAKGFLISLLLAIPETAGILGVLDRPLLKLFPNRKQVFITLLIGSRLLMVVVPLLALPVVRSSLVSPLWILAGVLATAEALQALSYLSYLSWLSDLVPETHWGRFFARRSIAKLTILVVVPFSGALLRDWWRHTMPEDQRLLAYFMTFSIGIGLQLISIWPLLRFPNLKVIAPTWQADYWQIVQSTWQHRSFRLLLFHNWHLSFANGLTQAVFFTYQFYVLKLSLTVYYSLGACMFLGQILISWLTGPLSDRYGNKTLLMTGVLFASCGLLFWLPANPTNWWWLFASYLLWSWFAMANICGRNLALILAPRSDNVAQLSLFRQIAGLLAGLSGLLGGIWLDYLNNAGYFRELLGYRFGSHQLLILLSFLGRITAVLWLIGIVEPGSRSLWRGLRARWRLFRSQ